MRGIFEQYFAIPLSIIVFLFLMPTVFLGGLTFATHLFGFLPNSGLCEKPAEVKK
jgi:hypothetical protein